MFSITETLNLKAAGMNKNKRIYNHASQVIKILDKIIIILLTNSSVNCEDKIKLVELGKRHYHFGVKKEYFKVNINRHLNSVFILLKYLLRFLKIVSLKVSKKV
jgi:hypothetical protein